MLGWNKVDGGAGGHSSLRGRGRGLRCRPAIYGKDSDTITESRISSLAAADSMQHVISPHSISKASKWLYAAKWSQQLVLLAPLLAIGE